MKVTVAITTVLTFAILGPPIGLFVFLLGLDLISLWQLQSLPSLWSVPERVGVTLYFMGYGFASSYIFGIIPAVTTGVLTAVGQNFLKRFGFIHVVLIGLICGLIFAQIFHPLRPPHFKDALLVVLTCLLPTIACWRISLLWHQKMNERSHEAE